MESHIRAVLLKINTCDAMLKPLPPGKVMILYVILGIWAFIQAQSLLYFVELLKLSFKMVVILNNLEGF